MMNDEREFDPDPSRPEDFPAVFWEAGAKQGYALWFYHQAMASRVEDPVEREHHEAMARLSRASADEFAQAASVRRSVQ